MTKKVVIIGGGFAGSLLARKLENRFDVTLIDSKNYFEFTPGIPRTLIKYDHLRKIQILHSKYLKKAEIVVGCVKEVGKESVLVNGSKIDFDYLVICSGSKYTSPFKEQDIVMATRGEHLKNASKELVNAKKVLIVGGGLVGVELASEISGHFDGKEITIIHSKEDLIERNPDRARKYVDKFLRKKGVEVIYSERVLEKIKGVFVTDKGNKIRPDIAFLCTGIIPNYEFMKKEFSGALSKGNKIIVNDYLQVKGCERIFAAGDVSDVREEKTAQNAERQSRLVAKNIIALESSKDMRQYEIRNTPLVISLGKYNGVFVWGNFIFTGILVGLLKWFIERREMFKLKYF